MPNRISGGQRLRRHIKTLERRRDYLAEMIRERTRGGGERPEYSVAELVALNWALPILNASLGGPGAEKGETT